MQDIASFKMYITVWFLVKLPRLLVIKWHNINCELFTLFEDFGWCKWKNRPRNCIIDTFVVNENENHLEKSFKE